MENVNKLFYKAAMNKDSPDASQRNTKILNESQDLTSKKMNVAMFTHLIGKQRDPELNYANLEQQVIDLKKQLEEKSKQTEELKEKKKFAEYQLSLRTDELEQSIIIQYKTAIDYLNDQLLTMKSQALNYDENFEKYQKIEEEYELMAIQLAKAKQALTQQFDQYDEQVTTQAEKIHYLTEELSKSKKYIEENQIEQLREAIKYQHEEAEKKQNQFTTQIEFYQQKITNLEDGIQQTTEENDKFKVGNQQLATELNKMLNELNSFQQNNNPEKNKQINSLNDLITSVNRQINDLKQQIETLNANLTQKNQELNQLQQQYGNQKKELLKTKDLVQKYHEEVTFINKNQNQLNSQLSETLKKAEELTKNDRMHQQIVEEKNREILNLKNQLTQSENQSKSTIQSLNEKSSTEIKKLNYQIEASQQKFNYQQEKFNNEKALLTQEINQLKQYYQTLKKKIGEEETNNLKANSVVQQLKNQIYKLQHDVEVLTQENKVLKYKQMKNIQDISQNSQYLSNKSTK